MRFNYLRKYTGYSVDDKEGLMIHYTFKYKRVPGIISASEIINNESLLSSFNQKDAFKIGTLVGRRKQLKTRGFFAQDAVKENAYWAMYAWVYPANCVNSCQAM